MKSTRIRIASVVATAALLTLTACSEPDPAPAPPTPTESTSATTSPTETPTDGETTPTETPTETPTLEVDPATGATNFCEKQDEFPFTGSAPEVFGQENVKDAYCEMGDLMISQSFLSSLVRADSHPDLDAQEFSVPRDFMTDSALKDWDAAVQRVVSGNQNDTDAYTVWALMFYSLYAENYSHYPEDSPEPAALNLSLSPAKTGVDKSAGEDRLLMRFTVKADVNMVRDEDEKPYLIPVSKEVSLYLVPTGGETTLPHNWYIDGWEADIKFGDPFPRPVAEPSESSNSN